MNKLFLLLANDWRMVINSRFGSRGQSVFKALVVGLFAAGILAGLFLLFLDAFRFLSTLGGIGVLLIQYMFSLAFFGLGFMLVISNIVTAYAACFRSGPVEFLLVRPVARGVILLHQHMESALLSSWAFFFIMAPFIGAFAWFQNLPLAFILWTIVFSVPFVMICSAAGVITVVAAARFGPFIRARSWGLAALTVVTIAVFIRQGHVPPAGASESTFMLSGLVPGIRLASFPLWPSFWVTDGIMAMVHGNWGRGLFFLGVLTANTLFLAMIVEATGNMLYQRAWERIASRAALGAVPGSRSATVAFQALRLLPQQMRAVVTKDMRVFFRDPVQVIQGLLFFGLLGLYFFNLRNLRYNQLEPIWRELIAYLNLFSLATIMCSFCSRFVYPQISLEGQAIWMIGLSPTGMRQVLKYKFWTSFAAMLTISLSLVALSCLMLRTPPLVMAVDIAVAAAVSMGLSALSLGLGAVFMDLKQSNPVAIISGFGGTFNLVLGLAFIMAAIAPFATASYRHAAGHTDSTEYALAMALSSLWLVVLTAAATFLPLAAGTRHLVSREY